MRSKTLTGWRHVVLIVFIVPATIAASLAILRYALLWRPSLESVAAQANQLIAAAGGPTKVLNEADEIFARVGISKEGWHPKGGRYEVPVLRSSELENYPALVALGKEHGVAIFPPRISIHIGGHKGFFIVIYPVKKPTVPDEVELFDSRIFVHQ